MGPGREVPDDLVVLGHLGFRDRHGSGGFDGDRVGEPVGPSDEHEPDDQADDEPSLAEECTYAHANRSQERQHYGGFDVVAHVHLLVTEYLSSLRRR